MKHPQPTPPRFAPVPAVPITVLSYRKGGCVVIVGGRGVAALTLREAVGISKENQ